MLTGAYGLFDEVHQLFVPTRTFQLIDIVIDFLGAIVGGLAWWWLLYQSSTGVRKQVKRLSFK